MNVTEIREYIGKSQFKTWYKNLSLNIKYPHAEFEISLIGFDKIYQFFKNESSFYIKLEDLPKVLHPSKQHFQASVNSFEQFVRSYLIPDHSGKGQPWSNLHKMIKLSENNRGKFFNKDSAYTDFLINIEKEFEGTSKGAYDFFCDLHLEYASRDKRYFLGWNMAYEFFVQDLQPIKRSKSEEKTISRIRSEYLKKLETTDSDVAEHIALIEEKYLRKEKAITKLIQRKNEQFEEWKRKSTEQMDVVINEKTHSFNDLEKLYQEKLKLEAPAKYWYNRADILKKEGNKWLRLLIAVILLAVIALGGVLYLISDGTLKDLFDKTGSAVRWSVVFVTFVSFLAYAIRTIAKLMFSSYHLYRDAQEREQLTYVYLALVKEKGVETVERNLIMQALFSRADSGLLKEDSAPTMPGGILEKVIGK